MIENFLDLPLYMQIVCGVSIACVIYASYLCFFKGTPPSGF